MPFVGVFPMMGDPLNRLTPPIGPAGPVGTSQLQQSGVPPIADRSITVPKDLSTLTSGGVTVTLNPSMQDPSSYIGQLNAAGIPCTINIVGELVLTAATAIPTASDANLLKVLGLT
jgi:hypothetical protein